MSWYPDVAARTGRLIAGAVIVTALTLTGCGERSAPDGAATGRAADRSSPSPSAQRPTAPPVPTPRTARVGQPIRVTQFDQQRLVAGAPEPWATADIVVSSVRTMRTDPAQPKGFRPRNDGRYVLIDVKTRIIAGAFTLHSAHFELIGPDGTAYDQNANVYYHKDYFRDVSDSKSRDTKDAGPGCGVILYDVPRTGLPRGSRVKVELYKGQAFSWLVS